MKWFLIEDATNAQGIWFQLEHNLPTKPRSIVLQLLLFSIRPGCVPALVLPNPMMLFPLTHSVSYAFDPESSQPEQ